MESRLDVRLLLELLLEGGGELVASLATAQGRRESLEHLEDLVFLHTTETLRRRGYSAKVITDLFGLSSLTSLRRKLRKIKSGRLLRTRSLRQAILSRVAEGDVDRQELLAHLKTRDAVIVKGVLRDLIDEGVIREGAGGYELALAHTQTTDPSDHGLQGLMHILLGHRAMTAAELQGTLGVPEERVLEVSQGLIERGVVRRKGDSFEAGPNWNLYPATDVSEAVTSLVHHFRAVGAAIIGTVRKWDSEEKVSPHTPPAVVTATFEIARDHPLLPELLAMHASFAESIAELYERIEASEPVEGERLRVSVYAGTAVADDVSG
ncbi:MAG: hypothetical protein AAGE52_09340 [Myxococcota bacterium]